MSSGYINDPTFDASVGEGLANLEDEDVDKDGDVIFGFSQGAVVASEYKRDNPGKKVTYVLVENPDRPNGGILERFDGLSIPILGVTANGATPNTGPTGAKTVDVSRQYDGWSDFPVYPLNFLADANAIAGIYYLHGKTQSEVSADDLEDAKDRGGIYYQNDTATNTEYYLIPTDRLPLLMPFDGIVPDPILDAADPPLRVLVELGYKRTDENGNTDYGTPTPVGIAPAVNPVTVATQLANATVQGVNTGLTESGVSTPNVLSASAAETNSATLTNLSASRHAAPSVNPQTPEVKLPDACDKTGEAQHSAQAAVVGVQSPLAEEPGGQRQSRTRHQEGQAQRRRRRLGHGARQVVDYSFLPVSPLLTLSRNRSEYDRSNGIATGGARSAPHQHTSREERIRAAGDHPGYPCPDRMRLIAERRTGP